MLAPMRSRIARSLGLAAASLALLGSGGELRVGAAASLRETVEAGSRQFEAARGDVRVRVSFGASSALAAQIRAGAPLDVLLSADLEIAQALAEAGLADPPRVLARNRLAVVASPDARLGGPDDLLNLRRIAVPEHAVPVGRYARQWLAARGLLDALRPRLVSTEHARATLAAADHGAVDAAIVYVTDARLARRVRPAFEIPPAEQPEILYAACALGGRGAHEPVAGYLDWWLAGPGRALLAEAGFGVDAP